MHAIDLDTDEDTDRAFFSCPFAAIMKEKSGFKVKRIGISFQAEMLIWISYPGIKYNHERIKEHFI